jgi:hypothetical protein
LSPGIRAQFLRNLDQFERELNRAGSLGHRPFKPQFRGNRPETATVAIFIVQSYVDKFMAQGFQNRRGFGVFWADPDLVHAIGRTGLVQGYAHDRVTFATSTGRAEAHTDAHLVREGKPDVVEHGPEDLYGCHEPGFALYVGHQITTISAATKSQPMCQD